MLRFCRSLPWIAATFVALAFGVVAAAAQTGYPDRPVKVIVPIGPGGSYDLVGRHLADVLSKRTGQAFFVENKPGAGTVVGTQAAAQSEPDGYTLLVGGLSNMAFNSALYSKLGYDPLRDFMPVALIYRFGYVMVGRKDLPQATLSDIAAAAKAGPGSITVATAGVGTGQHLVAAAFMKAAGVKLLEVPYKGSPRLSPISSRAASTCSSIRSRRHCPMCSRARRGASPCCHPGAVRWHLTCRPCRKPACPVSMSIPGLGFLHPPRPRRK
jgi:tripartite-type tricarboxylate transporter receptor subunit TctC